MTSTTAIARVQAGDFLPVMTQDDAVGRRTQLVQFVQDVMTKDADYGVIPGTNDKRVLLKPGAEKLANLFGLSIRFVDVEVVEAWTGVDPKNGTNYGMPFFYYRIRAQAWRGDLLVAEADGSCNSMEDKYGWRWVPEGAVPSHMDKNVLQSRQNMVTEFSFAIDKGETSGQYGKPAAYWAKWREAIDNGTARKTTRKSKRGSTMDAYEMGGTEFRIPNPEISSQVNTLLKMAQKRSLVAVILIAVGASQFFTQDIEVEGDDDTGTSRHAPLDQDVEQATRRVSADGERAASQTVDQPAQPQAAAQQKPPAQQQAPAAQKPPAQQQAPAAPFDAATANPTQIMNRLTTFKVNAANLAEIKPILAGIVARVNADFCDGFEPVSAADALTDDAQPNVVGAVIRACIVRVQRAQ